MNIAVSDLSEHGVKADIIIIPLFEAVKPERYADIDAAVGGLITNVIASKEFTGKQNQLTLLHVQHIRAGRVLLVGIGKVAELTSERMRQAGGKAFSYIKNLGLQDIAVSVRSLNDIDPDLKSSRTARYKPIVYFIEGGLLGIYEFGKYKKAENGNNIKRITILDNDTTLPLKRLQSVVSSGLSGPGPCQYSFK